MATDTRSCENSLIEDTTDDATPPFCIRSSIDNLSRSRGRVSVKLRSRGSYDVDLDDAKLRGFLFLFFHFARETVRVNFRELRTLRSLLSRHLQRFESSRDSTFSRESRFDG